MQLNAFCTGMSLEFESMRGKPVTITSTQPHPREQTLRQDGCLIFKTRDLPILSSYVLSRHIRGHVFV